MKLRFLFAAILLLPLAALRAGTVEDAAGVSALKSLKDMDDHPLEGIQFVVSEDWNRTTAIYRKSLPDTKQVKVTLLVIGGIPSSERGIQMFSDQREVHASDAPNKRYPLSPDNYWVNTAHLAALVEPGSLQFYRRDGDQFFFNFKSKVLLEGKTVVEMDGELAYSEKLKCVTLLQVSTQNEFKLNHRRRISSFSWQMAFTYDDRLKMVLPVSISWSTVGKKGISADYSDNYQAKMDNFDML